MSASAALTRLAKNMMHIILALVSFLEYFVGARPFLESRYGLYVNGLVDGIIVAVSSCALVTMLYAQSSDRQNMAG